MIEEIKKEWQWHWSADQENYQGPFTTKEKCIDEANYCCKTSGYNSFYIIEATKETFDLGIEEYQLFDIFDNNNEERVDPDGDSFSEQLKKEDRLALLKRVNETIEDWSNSTQMPPYVWAFNETRNEEQIVTSLEKNEGGCDE